MNKFIDQWNGFWFRESPPHIMAIVRIAFGLYLIAEALTYLPVADRMFSDQALTFSLWVDHVPSFMKPLLNPPSSAIAFIIASFYILACIGFTLGIAMRMWVVCLIVLFLYYWQLSFFSFPSSYHRIYFFVLCAFLVSGADKTFSLRMLRTHGSIFAWEPISVFAQRVIAVQMMFTYVGVGTQKAWLPAWQDGRALSMSLVGRWATPLGRAVVAWNIPFMWYSIAVELMKYMEVLLPFMLWTKRWRVLAVIFGILFHVGIAVLMSIWWFVALIPAYIVFWSPEEVFVACRRRFPRIPQTASI